VALAACAPAWGANYPTGWNGDNPFSCEIQNVGFGTDYPHPEADPFCVEFDKRRQNVSELGVVDVLSQEPARVAAASPKCFYSSPTIGAARSSRTIRRRRHEDVPAPRRLSYGLRSTVRLSVRTPGRAT
jgi:hypothetical protein